MVVVAFATGGPTATDPEMDLKKRADEEAAAAAFAKTAIKGRYVMLKFGLMDGTYIHIKDMQAFDEKDDEIQPISGEVNPLYSPSHSWAAMKSGGLAHTALSKSAYIRMDLGSDRIITRILIKNRNECGAYTLDVCQDRIRAVNVLVLCEPFDVVWSNQIRSTAAKYDLTVSAATNGKTV